MHVIPLPAPGGLEIPAFRTKRLILDSRIT
jgi:hypothetical protein